MTLAVTPQAAEPGVEATVSGEGYRGETKLYWDVAADGRLLASLTPDEGGRIDTPVALPADGP